MFLNFDFIKRICVWRLFSVDIIKFFVVFVQEIFLCMWYNLVKNTK